MEWLDKAIKAAGGYPRVAAEVGCSVVHLYNVTAQRRGASGELIARLRAVLPHIDAALWLELVTAETRHRKASAS